jgi:hypothetical protein
MKNKPRLLLIIIMLIFIGKGFIFAECPTLVTCVQEQDGSFGVGLYYDDPNNFPTEAPVVTFTYGNETIYNVEGSQYTWGNVYFYNVITTNGGPICTTSGYGLTITISFTIIEDEQSTEYNCEYIDGQYIEDIPPETTLLCPLAIACEDINDNPLDPINPLCEIELYPTFQMVFQTPGPGEALPSFQNVHFYYEVDPTLDGLYSACDVFNGTTALFKAPCAGLGPPGNQDVITLVFEEDTENPLVCTFVGGSYCNTCTPYLGPDCQAIIDECGQDIIWWAEYNLGNDCQQWKGTCHETTEIWRNGNVAIGTDEFVDNFELTVKGGIMTQIFKVCTEDDPAIWCDYVFEEDYDLMSLAEVEAYIDKNGHLHNTKSGNEIEECGGFELKSTTLNQQEKIEEIFLHLIDLKKQVDQIQTELIRD